MMKTVFLLIVVLTVAWWCVVWLVQPVNLAALSPPLLIALHVLPPVLPVIAWLIGKLTWKWNVTRKEKAHATEQTEQKETERKVKTAEREAELAQRRAYIDCRAAWLAVPETPRWFMDALPQCQILEQDADTLRNSDRETALSSSLRQVFDAALSQCKALAYLPLYLLPDHDDETALELVRSMWQEAMREIFPDEKDVPLADCRCLPDGQEPLPDRVLSLFENEPTMPALWLLGMDSLLENTARTNDGGRQKSKSGHAVAALVLSRSDLVLGKADTIEKPDLSNPLIPHWERDQGYRDAPHWGNIPPALREQFWGFLPIACVHRSRALSLQDTPARIEAGARQFRGLIENVLIDAALHDPPPLDGSKAKNPESLDFGNLFHNYDRDNDPVSRSRVTSITSALEDFGCWMNMDMIGNVLTEHGDTGAACSALMLAEAAMCTVIAQQPVMVAEWGKADRVSVGLVRPAA